MAKEPRAPWSRWDLSGVNPFPLMRLRDPADDGWYSPRIVALQPLATTVDGGGSRPPLTAPTPPSTIVTNSATTTLLAKEYNQFDSSFYNCIYGIPNEAAHLIEQCHVDVDCCETTCCDSGWRFKYGWALALLFLFCAAVAVVSVLWLAMWLGHRLLRGPPRSNKDNNGSIDRYHRYHNEDTYNNKDNYLTIGSKTSPKITPAPFPSYPPFVPYSTSTVGRPEKNIAGAEFRSQPYTHNLFKY